MEIGIIYFLIIVISNTIGAISGIGGGIIIRPIFDAIGYHNILAVSFYSSIAVLVMAATSIASKIKEGITIQRDLALLTAMGSIFGGVMGNLFLEGLVISFPREESILGIQMIVAVITLSISLLYTIKKWKGPNTTKKAMFFLIGGITGCIASFLGLGGGPLNVVAFMLFFGLTIKVAAVYSLFNIIFSQLARTITIGVTTGFQGFDLSMLAFIVPAAIIGGLMGSRVSNVLPETKVTKIYQFMLAGVIVLNIVNFIKIT